MNKVYNKERFIAYNKHIVDKKKVPYVIFLHGLMSDMNGKKALAIEKYCIKRELNFIRFDNFGHGSSYGKFEEETISSWLAGLELILSTIVDAPIILVGSSMGGWIALLSAIKNKSVLGVVGIASAPDFTEELLWDRLSDEKKEIMKKNGFCNIVGSNPSCNDVYPISYNLILDGRKHLLLGRQINIPCPVHLIHGMQDQDVPSNIAIRIADQLLTKQVTVKLIKDADHMLSRPQDLEVIINSIEELYQISFLTDAGHPEVT
jgi:hypothetical protein